MADKIEALLKEWAPKISEAFLKSIRQAKAAIDFPGVVRLLKAGDIHGAVQALSMDPAYFRALEATLEQVFQAGGEDAIAGLKPTRGPLGFRVAPVFDIRAPTADNYIRQRTADLIRQITEGDREKIRDALQPLSFGADPMLTGDTPQKIATDLVGRVNRVTGQREGGILGLTKEQARWAVGYEGELTGVPDAKALTRKLRDRRFDRSVAKAIREGRELAPETRQAMVVAYRNRALMRRATTIAENEAHEVLHQAQAEAWDQAVARGVVSDDQVRRFWVTAADDHVRPTHRAIPGMNKDGVGLHEPFQTPIGPTMRSGWQFEAGCRCRIRVRVRN